MTDWLLSDIDVINDESEYLSIITSIV